MIAEVHGVWASGGDVPKWIEAREVGFKHISIEYTGSAAPSLTPAQARYFASRLNRMARRLENQTKEK